MGGRSAATVLQSRRHKCAACLAIGSCATSRQSSCVSQASASAAATWASQQVSASCASACANSASSGARIAAMPAHQAASADSPFGADAAIGIVPRFCDGVA